jgi:type II secretory pathway predicted ATPase ExeA
MYLDTFKLKELPFRLSPDPEFLYLSKAHARAKAYMESTVWFTDGFVVITGEIGSGKTTLIETFLSELEKDIVVAQINQTQVSALEFLQTLLVQFGFTPFRMKKIELLATLNQFLVEQHTAHRKVLIVVDEAQNLSTRVLEEIRLLSGIESTKEKVLQIILVGQPELSDKLDSPSLVQLAQRVRLRFHLTPLSAADMQAYIRHRLDIAGSHGREIFLPECFELLFRYTGGVPRLINSLCDTAMLAAFNNESDTVRGVDVLAAIAELQWKDFASRTAAHLLAASAFARQDGRVPVLRPQDPGSIRPLARLLIATSGRPVGERNLHPGRLLIGRTAGNDLQIEGQFISRHHCQIFTTERLCVLEDLNSTNGVYIKSKRIRRHNLNDGDVVTVGDHELIYVDERTSRGTGDQAHVDDTDSHPVMQDHSVTQDHGVTQVAEDSERASQTGPVRAAVEKP